MEELVEHLIRLRALRSERIIEAMRSIDRKDFVRPEYGALAYADRALPIGLGQTISQPYTVIFMLELLGAEEGARVLDVGAGSGWTTALLGKIVGTSGRVYGVELLLELVKFGKKNLAKYDLPQASIQRAGEEYGLSEHAPFERILVSAAADHAPEELLDQLAHPGIMVMPTKGSIVKIEKSRENQGSQKSYDGFKFVPLMNSRSPQGSRRK